MAEIELKVAVRESGGKGTARKLRAAGQLPAVCYGPKQEARLLSLEIAELDRILRDHGRRAVLTLKVKGDRKLNGATAMIQELQREQVTGRFFHVDFLTIDTTAVIQLEVPLHLVGEAPGVSVDGGILAQNQRMALVETLPANIPENIEVDVSEMNLGDSLHLSDLTAPEGVTLIFDEDTDTTVVTVARPTVEAEPEVEVEEGELEEGAEVAEGESEEAGQEEDD